MEGCPTVVNLLVKQSGGVWGGAIGLSIGNGLWETWSSRWLHWLVSYLTTATTTTENLGLQMVAW